MMRHRILKVLSLASILYLGCDAAVGFAYNNSAYLNGSMGVTFPQVSTNSYVSPGATWPWDQYIDNSVSAEPLFSVSAGYAWHELTARLPFTYYSLGLSYTYIPFATIKGKIDQFSLPSFQNYNYQYQVGQQTLMAVFKTDLYRWQHVMPYLAAGLGASFNTAQHYAEYALPAVTPRIPPTFNSTATTYFAYTIGAGLNFIILSNLWLDVEYAYGNFGSIKLHAAGNNIYANETLNSTLTSNNVTIGVNYFFGSPHE